ncbi:MAG: hypothetical protein QM484_03500 [Woeseiaceae bacterium]
MPTFAAIIFSALVAHLLNGWLEPHTEESIRAMLVLVVSIVVFMLSRRYIKNLRG